jgi:2-keto-3-deoxy-L-rhamnonate aldolase RhmA
MSQLQKKITRVQRREGASMGFGAAARHEPRAMLLAALAADAGTAKAAIEAGADVVVLRGDAAAQTKTIEALVADKVTVGVWTDALDEKGAETLAKAGCDFVISPLDATASAAVDTERMGQLVIASESMDDTTLRSLGPLGLDGLFVERAGGAMTLGQQLALVRISSFASSQLMATVATAATSAELRVLRDSGVATVVTPAGATAAEIKALVEALKAVPAPRRARDGAREIALVPSVAAGQHEEEDDDDDDDGE